MSQQKLDSGRGPDMHIRTNFPRTAEDKLLSQYWEAQGGRLHVEVPIGGQGGEGRWPKGCRRRRIDGVRFVGLPRNLTFHSEFNSASTRDDLAKSDAEGIEIIDVKRKLDRLVMGQVLVAQDMFERQYGVRPAKLPVVCGGTDPGLEWVCKEKRGISVWCAPSFPSR